MAFAIRRAALKGSALFGAAAVGIAYYQRLPRSYGDHRSEWSEGWRVRFYRSFIAPLVMTTDPETAHVFTLRAAGFLQSIRLLAEPSWTGPTPLDWLLRPMPSIPTPSGPSIRQDLFGGRLSFESPFGIAAGFDKNAELVPMYRLGALTGLGFSEVGSVSALPSEGNPKPRCFRLPEDEAVINRMGLNNEGSEAIAAKLKSYEVLGRAASPVAGAPARAPVGVNITKTHSPSILGDEAVEDFVTSYRRLVPYADFMVLNISCPNTAEGKTFEDRDTLAGLLARIAETRREAGGAAASTPMLVKLAPPPDTEEGRQQLRELVDVARSSGTVDGFVISNTAGDRNVPLSAEGQEASAAIGRGGLSGRPLRARSTAAIREVFRLTGGSLPIVGVGGIDSAEVAYEKIRAGASLVEVYTGLVYKSPWLFSDMHVGLRRLLERDGFSSVSEAVGADVRSGP